MIYRVPVVIKGFAIVKFPDGKAVGDYVGGLPRDAEEEVLVQPPPFLCGAPMEACTLELTGEAELVQDLDRSGAYPWPLRSVLALRDWRAVR